MHSTPALKWLSTRFAIAVSVCAACPPAAAAPPRPASSSEKAIPSPPATAEADPETAAPDAEPPESPEAASTPAGDTADPVEAQQPGRAARTPPPEPPLRHVSWFEGGGGLFVPPYYDRFDGVDLSPLSAVQRERFLHWVNSEYCSCSQSGCERDTIANCVTNDPTCPRAPVRLRQILELVRGGGHLPWHPGLGTLPAPLDIR